MDPIPGQAVGQCVGQFHGRRPAAQILLGQFGIGQQARHFRLQIGRQIHQVCMAKAVDGLGRLEQFGIPGGDFTF